MNKNQKLVGWACRVWTETDNGWEPTSAVFPTKGHAEEWGNEIRDYLCSRIKDDFK